MRGDFNPFAIRVFVSFLGKFQLPQCCVDAHMLDQLRIILHSHTRTHRVAITKHVVHAADVRPEFVVVQALRRERRRFARVRMIPVVAGDLVRRVRSIFQ